jgi:hypothetical protein
VWRKSYIVAGLDKFAFREALRVSLDDLLSQGLRDGRGGLCVGEDLRWRAGDLRWEGIGEFGEAGWTGGGEVSRAVLEVCDGRKTGSSDC